jgi:arabinofuranan 3-O-arabinosyltransferase
MHPLILFIVHPWTRYVLSWLLGLGLAGLHLYLARHMYDTPTGDPAKERRDGNFGHTLVDFGGQWLTAHLVAVGRGHELFLKPAQREVLEVGYPRGDEPPAATEHDADKLWVMEVSPDFPGGPPVSGPLYPPTHAVMFAPLGLLPPRQSYQVAQVVFLACAWVAGLAVAGISRWRIWWPIAASFVMIFPGFGPSLHLAQNSALTLAILMIGWWLVSRGMDVSGGIVWGLLAYKPVWAAAFLLVPLLTRRWRMLAAMVVTGIVLALATVPIVGVRSWLHWLRIGQSAAALYKIDENWVFLSRDLLGIPRRWLLDFDAPAATRDRPEAAIIGWSLWAIVVATTILVALRRRRVVQPADGYGAAFVALGAFATCFHFIYYDCLLAVLPMTMLLADPRRFVRPILVAVGPAPPKLAGYFSPRPLAELPHSDLGPVRPFSAAVLNSFVLTAFASLILIEQGLTNLNAKATILLERNRDGETLQNALTFSTGQHGTPWDTFVLLALWGYCGIRVLMGSGDPSEPGGERPQVAIVDADQPGAALQDARQLLGVVKLDERIHAQRASLGKQSRQVAIAEDLGNQEDCIGAGHAGLQELIAIEDEVLAEDRQVDGSADRGEILQSPLKERLIGQHADAGGPMSGVRPGDGDRIEIRAQHACRRRRFLDFRDDADRPRAFERCADWPGRGRVGEPTL